MANKNSVYIQSLVDFLHDTKPYHSKLTEINEIYQFTDKMSVNIGERLYSTNVTKAAWPYSYFSGGISFPAPSLPFHELISPQFRAYAKNSTSLESRGAFKVNRDENTDLPLVPLAFDPKSIQGVGISDAMVQRSGIRSLSEPLLEGHDFFQSHGAYTFQIKQTISSQPKVLGQFSKNYSANSTNDNGEFILDSDGQTIPNEFPLIITLAFTADALIVRGPATQITSTQISVHGIGEVKVIGLSNLPNYAPTFTERANENLISHVTSVVQIQALDLTNPNSSIRRIKDIMSLISDQLLARNNASAITELNLINEQLEIPILPNSYEALINALIAGNTPVALGFTGWRGQDVTLPYADTYVDQALSALSPSLYFNEYNDISQQESAALAYQDITSNNVSIFNIEADNNRDAYEEWTLEVASSTSFNVRGSSTGVIGSGVIGELFTSPQLSFRISNNLLTIGSDIVLTPKAKITVHSNAALEAWSLIKVNPIAYSRPTFSSTRYGYVKNSTSVKNKITVLDVAFPTSTIVLTAISKTQFTVTCSAEPDYNKLATVNSVFNDSRLIFTIISGSIYDFVIGDKFFIEIQNDSPVPEELDLYYGYDSDSYDANTLVYNSVNSATANYLTTLDFGFDSRFLSYDTASFNLSITQNAQDNRQWRLRALADFANPLMLQNSTPENKVNLIGTSDNTSTGGTDSPQNPNTPQRFNMLEEIQGAPGVELKADLMLWYSSIFALEYFDAERVQWTTVATVPVGVQYVNDIHGLSFTIVPASKPFIASRSYSTFIDNNTGLYTEEEFDGGDIISWAVRNSPPIQLTPSSLSSARIPRLIMHGDSFQHSVPAKYDLQAVSANSYTLQGTYTTGDNNGSLVFKTPILIDTSINHSFKNDEFGIHYTVVTGQHGISSGDAFTFETFLAKPCYLVHGSVSGWQDNAELGKYYWNGKIGFKLALPKIEAFENNFAINGDKLWSASFGPVKLNRVRLDSSDAVYTVKAHNDGYWMLYRDGAIVGSGAELISDKFLSLTMPTAVAGAKITFQILADDHTLSTAHDLAIIRTTAGRTPSSKDFILIERTESDSIQVSIKAKDPEHAAVLSSLAQSTIDVRFVDHQTRSGVPLVNTSPEVAVLSGWIPALLDRQSNTLLTSVFNDPALRTVVRAAATGEIIGTVKYVGITSIEHTVFQWDSEFHAKYLPLNTEATVLALGSGMNENIHVNMHEGIMMLISGGGLADSMLFADISKVNIADTLYSKIISNYFDSEEVKISDGPFVGFLPGYDNLPYDFELGGDISSDLTASYDIGSTLTEYFNKAKLLSLKTAMSPTEQSEYNNLIDTISPYLINGSLSATLLNDFIHNLNTNVFNGTEVSGFGIPSIGLGIDIQDSPTVKANTAILEAMTLIAIDAGYQYDQHGFDVGAMDVSPESTAIVFSSENAPLPKSGLPSIGTVYSDYDTPLIINAPGARVLELSFLNPPENDPIFYIWEPSEEQPRVVPIVDRISSRRFRFSLSSSSELKLVVI
jgi:hypothetical protein